MKQFLFKCDITRRFGQITSIKGSTLKDTDIDFLGHSLVLNSGWSIRSLNWCEDKLGNTGPLTQGLVSDAMVRKGEAMAHGKGPVASPPSTGMLQKNVSKIKELKDFLIPFEMGNQGLACLPGRTPCLLNLVEMFGLYPNLEVK